MTIAKPDKSTIIVMPNSTALIAHAAAAIHAVTISQHKPASMRSAAIAGFDQIIDDRRIDVAILLKIFEKYDYKGKGRFYIGFNDSEMRLLRECRLRLEAMWLQKLDRVQTVTLALMRIARPEFGQDVLMDVRALPAHDKELHD